MLRQITLIGLLLLTTSWSCNVLPTSEGASGERPNVLVIVADDLGYADLGCSGGGKQYVRDKQIQIPHPKRY